MKGRLALFYAHGSFDGTRSIGTELALASMRCGARMKMVPVPINPRTDEPRFGSVLMLVQRFGKKPEPNATRGLPNGPLHQAPKNLFFLPGKHQHKDPGAQNEKSAEKG